MGDTTADLRPAAPEGCRGHSSASRAQALGLWFQIFKYSWGGNLKILLQVRYTPLIPTSIIWWGLGTLCRCPKGYYQRSLPSFFSSFLSHFFLLPHCSQGSITYTQEGGGNVCKPKICFLRKIMVPLKFCFPLMSVLPSNKYIYLME